MRLSFSLPFSVQSSSEGQALWFAWNANSSNGPTSKKPSLTLRLNEISAVSCSLLYSQQYFENTF